MFSFNLIWQHMIYSSVVCQNMSNLKKAKIKAQLFTLELEYKISFPLPKVETKSERAASKIFKRKLRFLKSTSIHIKHCNALSRQGAIDQLKYMNMFEGWVSQMVFELFPRLTALQYLNCSRCRITLTFSVWVQHHNSIAGHKLQFINKVTSVFSSINKDTFVNLLGYSFTIQCGKSIWK